MYTNTALVIKDGEEIGRFVYRPDKPLSCGAHVWFETNCEVITKTCKEEEE